MKTKPQKNGKASEISLCVHLNNGGVSLVDYSDYDMIVGYSWRRRDEPHTSYAYTVVREKNLSGKKKHKLRYVLMHRLLLGLKDPLTVVDHQNHNGLDNRRCNIKPCTQKDNIRNSRRFTLKHL